MASPTVSVDVFNPLIQRLLDDFEGAYFPEGGLESQERAVKREYIKHAKIPFLSGLMDRVLSGDWGWGTTQKEVGEELGLDRSRLSDALRKGEMSIDTFVAILLAQDRPPVIFPDPSGVENAVKRSGFIGVARHLARFVRDRATLTREELNEIRHELLCSVFKNYLLWTRARLGKHEMVAADIVESVCSDNRLGIMPGWYTDEQNSEIKKLVAQLRSSASAAMTFLCRLQDNWEDIYVAAAQVTETIELRIWNP